MQYHTSDSSMVLNSSHLKGTASRDFRPFYICFYKTPPGRHMNRQKTVLRRLRGHTNFKYLRENDTVPLKCLVRLYLPSTKGRELVTRCVLPELTLFLVWLFLFSSVGLQDSTSRAGNLACRAYTIHMQQREGEAGTGQIGLSGRPQETYQSR